MICPIMSYHKEYVTTIICKKENCAWYDKNMECCCIKTITDNIDDLVKGQRTIYTGEV